MTSGSDVLGVIHNIRGYLPTTPITRLLDLVPVNNDILVLAITLLALYLSIISLYHALVGAVKLAYFMVKWGIIFALMAWACYSIGLLGDAGVSGKKGSLSAMPTMKWR